MVAFNSMLTPLPSSPKPVPVAAIILAGGHSRRMGQDKALLKIGEQTFLQFLVGSLATRCSPVFIIGRQDQQLKIPAGCSFQVDRWPDQGPAAGLATGLEAAAAAGPSTALVVAVDTPCFPPGLVDFFLQRLDEFDAVIPFMDGHLYGLSALYRTSAAGRIAAMVQSGNLRLQELPDFVAVKQVAAETLKEIDPHLFSLTGVNTRGEYEQLRRIWPTTGSQI